MLTSPRPVAQPSRRGGATASAPGSTRPQAPGRARAPVARARRALRRLRGGAWRDHRCGDGRGAPPLQGARHRGPRPSRACARRRTAVTLILDAGALIAVERGDRQLLALLNFERLAGRPPLPWRRRRPGLARRPAPGAPRRAAGRDGDRRAGPRARSPGRCAARRFADLRRRGRGAGAPRRRRGRACHLRPRGPGRPRGGRRHPRRDRRRLSGRSKAARGAWLTQSRFRAPASPSSHTAWRPAGRGFRRAASGGRDARWRASAGRGRPAG